MPECEFARAHSLLLGNVRLEQRASAPVRCTPSGRLLLPYGTYHPPGPVSPETFYLVRARRFPCERTIARTDLALMGGFFLGVLPGNLYHATPPECEPARALRFRLPNLGGIGLGRPICRSGAFSLGRALGL